MIDADKIAGLDTKLTAAGCYAASLFGGLRRVFKHAAANAVDLLSTHSGTCCICNQSIGRISGLSNSPVPISPKLSGQLCAKCLSEIEWLYVIRCRICGRGILCDDCLRRVNRSFVCNRSAVQYSPVMREWLALYKYRGHERLLSVLAEMLIPAFQRISIEALNNAGIKERMSYAKCWDAVTYVPISAERAIDRGFNQAEQLASYLAEKFGLPLFPLLQRNIDLGKMSFKSRSERIRDAKGLFAIHDKGLLDLYRSITDGYGTGKRQRNPSQPIRVLLVDDIYTTGSTSDACAYVLQNQVDMPIQVYLLTWARS